MTAAVEQDTGGAALTPRTALPYSFAKRFGILVAELASDPVHLICRDGFSPQAAVEARRALGRPIRLESVAATQFDLLLQSTYEGGSDSAIETMDSLDEHPDLNDIADHLPEPEDLMESQDEAPIIRLINALLTEAVREGASDIHIEPFENRLAVRFRVDGVLRDILQPRRQLASLLTSRIKVMAHLDIAERRLPQDGRISLKVAGRPVDIRVSTLPSGHGERVVMRLLDKKAGLLDLFNLGMDEKQSQIIDRLIHQPHGIFLVTGPTGSGKTTTLYAALSRLNDARRNIMTIEDPIEYFIDGIGQTQVNPKVDMTFARGLRAILRQDPDIVMVGEIRDRETMEIAVQSSLTGHLVLSTLHTNSAIGAITRLRDMGIEPFLLSSSVIGVLAQRLVRLLCPVCKSPYQPSQTDVEQYRLPRDPSLTLYHPTGCPECNQSGYTGRTGIYELIEVDNALSELIHDGSPEHEMERYIRQHFSGIRTDGIRRAVAGETSLEEVLRVTASE